jgi:predicted alpha/beta hydrolase family esterase
MKQVILIHGQPEKEDVFGDVWPSESNSHWLPWIQKQLSRKDILCQALEMPHPYNPMYQDHCSVLDQMNISHETILVGHSLGGGFLLRYFSEYPEKIPAKIILVAPWVDTDNYLKDQGNKFFDFTIDQELVKRTHIDCIYSTDDEETLDSVYKIREALPNITCYEFTNKGHFTEPDLGTKEFPELLEIILK